jgi:hypothetical protein
MTPNVEGVKNSEKTNHRKLQRSILERQKNSIYVVLLLLEVQDDL